MPSSYTSRFKLELPVNNDLVGTWGNQVNTAITSLLDETIDAVSSIAMGDANVTLTIPNGATSPNRAGTLVLTGANTAIRTLTVPSGDRVLRIVNATTGGFSVLVKNPSSGTLSVLNGYMAMCYFIGSTATMPGYQMPSASITSAILGGATIGFNDGDAVTPSITFGGDTDTGIYRIGANSIGITTAAANRVSISSAGLITTTDLKVDRTAVAATFTLNTSDVRQREIDFRTANVERWGLFVTSDAEAGSNSGSNFRLIRYDDAGAILSGSAIGVNRDTGNVGINNVPLSDVRLYVVFQAAEAVLDARAIRAININTASDATVSMEFATAAGALRGSVKGKREGATNHGSLLLYSALTGVEQLCLTLASNLNATFTGTVAAPAFVISSDARLKTNVRDLEAPLARLRVMRGLSFDKLGAKHRQAGVIAQDARQTMPEAVVNTGNIEHGYDDVLAVDPMAMIALLIEAVKELDRQVQSSLNPNKED